MVFTTFTQPFLTRMILENVKMSSERCCVSSLKKDINVLFLTSDNEFSGIFYSLFRVRHNIFLIIFSIKSVVKCANILKIG